MREIFNDKRVKRQKGFGKRKERNRATRQNTSAGWPAAVPTRAPSRWSRRGPHRPVPVMKQRPEMARAMG